MRVDKRQPIEAFRADVHTFISERAPRSDVRDGLRVPADATEEAALRDWYRELFGAGLLGGGWPTQWGGDPDHRSIHDTVVMEELIRARAPRPLDQTLLAAHCLIGFGTAAQQAAHLPRIRNAEDVWCQLFSEPGVGTDLAALSTRADPCPDGSGFQVTGQKVWSTDAQWAQMGILLARTDPESSLHDGITAFLLPMQTPGVTVRPLREMTGHAEFCEVFLDGVHVSAEHVLGAVNNGWTVTSSGLASERGYVGANSAQLEVMHQDLVALARTLEIDGRPAIEHDHVRQTLASLRAEVAAVHTSADRAAGPDPDSAGDAAPLVAKLAYSELNVRMCQSAADLIVNGRGSGAAYDRLRDDWFHSLLWSRALTISGGSSELIRSLVAQHLLGMPRSWSRAS